MILHIINNTTLGDVQSSFSKSFPYLKIEFISVIKEDTTINEFHSGLQINKFQKKKLFPNLIQVQPWYKYVDVKNLFNAMFELPVKLFRRNEGAWIEAPEDLTVEEINKIARHSTEYYLIIKREKQIHIW